MRREWRKESSVGHEEAKRQANPTSHTTFQSRKSSVLVPGNGSDRKYEPLSMVYKKNLSRDTEQFFLTNPLFSIRSTIFSFLLTVFFCYLFLDPPRGYA